MKFTKILIVGLAFFLSSCGKNCPEVDLLQWIKKADATSDAKEALNNGDFRYKAVYGISLMIPGIDGNNGDYVAIEGTSDAICSRKHEKLAVNNRQQAGWTCAAHTPIT